MTRLISTAVPRVAFYTWQGYVTNKTANYNWGGAYPTILTINHNQNKLTKGFELFHKDSNNKWIRRNNLDFCFTEWTGWDACCSGADLGLITLNLVQFSFYHFLQTSYWVNSDSRVNPVEIKILLYD